MRETESLFKQSPVLAWKCCYIFLHLSSPNLIENDHNFVFFSYKVSTQQRFKSRLFEKLLPRSWEFTHKWRCLIINAIIIISLWWFLILSQQLSFSDSFFDNLFTNDSISSTLFEFILFECWDDIFKLFKNLNFLRLKKLMGIGEV